MRGDKPVMWKRIANLFALPGSWAWACKQMRLGNCVRPKAATGTVRYALDPEDQGRIMWTFCQRPSRTTRGDDWDNANIFLEDFDLGWEVIEEVLHEREEGAAVAQGG